MAGLTADAEIVERFLPLVSTTTEERKLLTPNAAREAQPRRDEEIQTARRDRAATANKIHR